MSDLPPPANKPGWAPPPGPAGPTWGAPQDPSLPGWGAPTTNRYTEPASSPYGSQWGPPGQDPKRKYKRGALIWSALGGAVVAFIATFALVIAIGVAVGSSNSVSNTHGRVAEGERATRVGDCLAAKPPRATVTDRSMVIDCDRTHGSEVVGVVALPDAKDYPSGDDLGAFADAACAIPFRSYVGESVDDSDADLGTIPPNRTAFNDGERRVWCLVNSATYHGGRGTVRDSG